VDFCAKGDSHKMNGRQSSKPLLSKATISLPLIPSLSSCFHFFVVIHPLRTSSSRLSFLGPNKDHTPSFKHSEEIIISVHPIQQGQNSSCSVYTFLLFFLESLLPGRTRPSFEHKNQINTISTGMASSSDRNILRMRTNIAIQ
jgi:hypothetical protein